MAGGLPGPGRPPGRRHARLVGRVRLLGHALRPGRALRALLRRAQPPDARGAARLRRLRNAVGPARHAARRPAPRRAGRGLARGDRVGATAQRQLAARREGAGLRGRARPRRRHHSAHLGAELRLGGRLGPAPRLGGGQQRRRLLPHVRRRLAHLRGLADDRRLHEASPGGEPARSPGARLDRPHRGARRGAMARGRHDRLHDHLGHEPGRSGAGHPGGPAGLRDPLAAAAGTAGP